MGPATTASVPRRRLGIDRPASAAGFRPLGKRRPASCRSPVDGRRLYGSHNSAIGGDLDPVVGATLATVEKQGPALVAHDVDVAGDLAGCAIGDLRDSRRQRRLDLPSSWRGYLSLCRLVTAAVRKEQRFDSGQHGCSVTDGAVRRGGQRAVATRPQRSADGTLQRLPLAQAKRALRRTFRAESATNGARARSSSSRHWRDAGCDRLRRCPLTVGRDWSMVVGVRRG